MSSMSTKTAFILTKTQ